MATIQIIELDGRIVAAVVGGEAIIRDGLDEGDRRRGQAKALRALEIAVDPPTGPHPHSMTRDFLGMPARGAYGGNSGRWSRRGGQLRLRPARGEGARVRTGARGDDRVWGVSVRCRISPRRV